MDIACHQELSPIKLIPDGRNGFLYGQGIAGGKLEPHATPPPFSHHQLKADDIQTVKAEILNGEVLRLAVEDRDATTISAWLRRCRYLKADGLPRVKSVDEFGLLQHGTINLYLLQPANIRFQTSVPYAPDIICAKPHHFLQPPSTPSGCL